MMGFTGFRSAKWSRVADHRNMACAVIAGLFLTASVSVAQSASEVESITKDMSEQGKAVITQLSTLNQLSAVEWRYHAGDLAHGESASLDDSTSSGWTEVK